MRHMLFAAVAALTLVAGCAGGPPQSGGGRGANNPGAAALTSIYPRNDRPTVAWPDRAEVLDGTPFDPATMRGRIVVVNFWASWCGPCRAEAPELNAAAEATRDLGVLFLGVNVRDGRDAARSFVAGREAYPSIYDPAGRVVLGFAAVTPNTIPATVVVDRAGGVAVAVRRAVTERELVSLIRGVAAETSPPAK